MQDLTNQLECVADAAKIIFVLTLTRVAFSEHPGILLDTPLYWVANGCWWMVGRWVRLGTGSADLKRGRGHILYLGRRCLGHLKSSLYSPSPRPIKVVPEWITSPLVPKPAVDREQ